MSSAALRERVRTCVDKPDFVQPMAVLWVRFQGAELQHLGNTVALALQKVLAHAPATTRWRGVVPKGAKTTRYATSRTTDPTGLRPVFDALKSLKSLPKNTFGVYFKDGSNEGLAPETFAVWLSLVDSWEHTFSTPKGLLSCAFPLELLERSPSTLLQLGDALVELLEADAAGLSPGVWLAPQWLFNGGSNELPENETTLLELFGVDPQLEAPHLLASRWPHVASEVKPDLFSGVLAPAWAMWLDRRLVKKVNVFSGIRNDTKRHARFMLSATPPFTMNEETYAQWRAGWLDLKPVHLECSEESATGRFYRQRLGGETWSGQLAQWRAADEKRVEATKRANAMLRKMAEAESQGIAALLEVAEQARTVLEPGSVCWSVIPRLVDALAEGTVEPSVAAVWLDYGEETQVWGRGGGNRAQLTLDAAALAAALGLGERALALIREAYTDEQGRLSLTPPFDSRLKRDKRFKSLRKLPKWAQLFS